MVRSSGGGQSFADDLARYLPGGAGGQRADLGASSELLRLKVAPTLSTPAPPLTPLAAGSTASGRGHDADDLLDGNGGRLRRRLGQASGLLSIYLRFSRGTALAVAKTLSMSGNDFTVTDAATGALLLASARPLQPPPLPPRRRPPPVLTVQESLGLLRLSVSPLCFQARWFLLLQLSTRPREWLVAGGSGGDEHAVEGVLEGQRRAGPALHGGEAVGDPATMVHQGRRLPRQRTMSSRPGLPDHRAATTTALLRLLGESDTLIARSTASTGGRLLGKNASDVTVNAGIDYAFIVASPSSTRCTTNDTQLKSPPIAAGDSYELSCVSMLCAGESPMLCF
ncbi:hypothetical protein ZWY2020_017519 [Hordeum vulgare]|nr:hypothetical protein ZWY2020_017519 [Hordeum vulgare]